MSNSYVTVIALATNTTPSSSFLSITALLITHFLIVFLVALIHPALSFFALDLMQYFTLPHTFRADPSNPSESERILVNSDHIPTSVLPKKKKGSKSHSEPFRVNSESFQPTGRNQKKIFLTKSESKIPSRFRVNSEHS